MKPTMIKLAAAAGIVALASGCGSRRPPELPPEPPAAGETGSGTAEDPFGTDTSGGVSPAELARLRQAFIAAAGTDRVLFALDSYTLDTSARAILDAQARWLVANPAISVTIEGHADERGTREYNLALGDRRANSARNYLEARGVPASRMTTISWGKERPAAEGSNQQAWAQNRRAVTVLPE